MLQTFTALTVNQISFKQQRNRLMKASDDYNENCSHFSRFFVFFCFHSQKKCLQVWKRSQMSLHLETSVYEQTFLIKVLLSGWETIVWDPLLPKAMFSDYRIYKSTVCTARTHTQSHNV